MEGEARRRQVAVIGSGACEPDSELAQLAEAVGAGLAAAGAVVVCGGMGGVMKAAARGAAAAGGTTIGILPGESPDEGNPHLTHAIATGVGHARNLAVVASGEAVVAVGGEWGTLAEIGYARRLGRPVIALRSWRLEGEGAMRSAPGIVVAETAEEAVSAALGAI
jgi:uncharacterized protein (TIGR00725 family)